MGERACSRCRPGRDVRFNPWGWMSSHIAEGRKSESRRLSLSLAAAVLLALAALAWTVSRPNDSFDDSYITYRYARNLAQGQGFVYNVGERVLGTTTPLYALVLAGVARVWPDIPTASLALGGLGWAGLIVLVYGLGRAAGSPLAGLVAAAILAFDPLLYSTLGMETTLYVALSLAAFVLLAAGRPRGAALVAGLVFLMRWDGILVIAVILLAEVLRTRRLPWQAAACWLALAAPWLIFSQAYFGSIFPNSFFAKAGQANSGLVGGGAEPFATAFLQLAQDRLRANPLWWIYLPLALVSPLNGRAWLKATWPLFLWTALYFAGFIAVGVIGFHWYYAPLMPAIALAVGAGIAYLTRLAAATRNRWTAPAMALGLAAVCVWPQAQLLWVSPPGTSARLEGYRQVSQWLEQNTAPNSSVALLEIGFIGYQTNRPVVDIMGLVTPTMVGHLGSWDEAFYYAVTRNWPEYLVLLQGMGWTHALHTNPLGDIYSLAETIKPAADPLNPILIYRRRPDFPPAAFAAEWPQDLVFDHLFTLVSIQAAAGALAPGQALPVRLNWTVNADVKADYHFDLELVDLSSGQRQVLLPEGRPMYGSAPTTEWRRGNRYAQDLLLPVPQSLPPGAYRLLVRATVDGRAVEPAQAATGQTATAMTGVLEAAPSAAGQQPPGPAFTSAPLEFAEGITLLGYRLAPTGGALNVTLYWRANQPVASPRTVFIHIMDENQQLIGQHDGPPAAGDLPVTLWGPGVTVTDAHPVPLSAPATAARTLCVGLYDPGTLERLRVVSGAGYDIRDNVACRPITLGP
jgi:arabinofuranosyltransferase